MQVLCEIADNLRTQFRVRNQPNVTVASMSLKLASRGGRVLMVPARATATASPESDGRSPASKARCRAMAASRTAPQSLLHGLEYLGIGLNVGQNEREVLMFRTGVVDTLNPTVHSQRGNHAKTITANSAATRWIRRRSVINVSRIRSNVPEFCCAARKVANHRLPGRRVTGGYRHRSERSRALSRTARKVCDLRLGNPCQQQFLVRELPRLRH